MASDDTLAQLAAQAAATIELAAIELKAGHVIDDKWPDDEVDARAFYETDMKLVTDIRDALTAQAPAGWVSAPVEPTDAMLDAGKHEAHSSKGIREKCLRIYRAMLAARPQAEEPQA